MKIESKKLAAALSKVIGIVGRRTTLPILGCVLIQSRDNTLEITASDLDCWATAKCECDGKLEPVCVSGRLLHGLIQNAPEWMNLTIDGGRLIIEGNGRAGVSFLKAEEFPPFPNDKLKAVGVNPSDLADCIEAVVWAASTKDDRYVLKSVHVKLEADKVTCTATNGTLLARMQRNIIASDGELLVTPSHCLFICESLRGKDSIVELSENRLVVHSESLAFSSRLMEGIYPNTKPVINPKREDVGLLPVAELIDALSTVVSLAKEFPKAQISPTRKGMEIEFKDDVNEFKTTVGGKFEGKPFRINAAYWAGLLRSIPDQENAKLYRTDLNSIIIESGDYLSVLQLLSDKSD